MGRRKTDDPEPPAPAPRERADVSEGSQPEPLDPDMPEIGDVALRYTFRVLLEPAAARAVDQAVSAALEADVAEVSFPDVIDAATSDLESLLRFLDYWADNAGDRPDRHEIHLAAAVLDTLPLLGRTVDTLRAQVQRARQTAPAERP